MTSTTSIPLNRLVAWNGNVRKTAGADTALAELAASISAHGLLQSLVVRKGKKDTYAVVAGGRRLAALQSLAESGRIAKDYPVPCHVIADDADATEISLVENSVREDMHPADEFEAFRDLIDRGMAAADVAARFGVTETVVIKRMKLARVSPVIVKAYREDEISLECLMAFAVTDDHKRQETLWETGPDWLRTSPRSIREHLTELEIDASDRRVRFVTLEAYEQAGGAVRRDLFSHGDDGIFIDNVDLLNQLVTAKLEQVTDALRSEGWKWVEVLHERGYETRSKLRRLDSTEGPLPAELQAEYEQLSAELKKLEARKKPSEADADRISEIEDRIHELDYERPEVFTPEQIAVAGVFLEIEHDGSLDITRGYVRPEDAKAIQPDAKNGKPKAAKAELSQSLAAELLAHREAAIAALLMDNPRVSLAAIVHSLGMRLFYGNPLGRSLDIDITGPRYPQNFRQPGNSSGIDAIESSRAAWKKKLPGKQAEFWQWCLDADQKTLLSLLAFFAALSGNHTDALRAELGLDMKTWFTPTAANFFSRIGKDDIIEAVKEATGKPLAPATEKLKKSELALFAERAVKGTGWLPKLLRAPAVKPAKKPQAKTA